LNDALLATQIRDAPSMLSRPVGRLSWNVRYEAAKAIIRNG
jgi:hypothetical protein